MGTGHIINNADQRDNYNHHKTVRQYLGKRAKFQTVKMNQTL